MKKINVTFSTILFIPISHTNLVMKVLSDNKINTVDLFIFTDVRHIWLLFFALKITCPDNTVIPISRKEKLKQYICITTVDIRIEMLFINRRIATFTEAYCQISSPYVGQLTLRTKCSILRLS